MQAIILASGTGSRLRPFTDENPKPLVEVNGEKLLDRMINFLTNQGINDIIITTGHLHEKLIQHVKENHPDVNVRFVHSDRYAETNYIYSLWLAKELINDDVLTFHGDLIFDLPLLEKVINNSVSGVLLDARNETVPEKDFKARVKDNAVTEIGVNVFGDDAYFCIPIYKLLHADWNKWMDKINDYINEGQDTCYAENAFNEISSDLKLEPIYFDDGFAMEIDDHDDLKKANEKFSQ